VENIILKFLKTSFSHLEKMFKRYSKNGGETSTFCHVAVLAREAERLSSLRLEYELDPKLEEGRTTSRRFSDRYHLVSLHPATSFVNCESRSLRHLIRSSVSLVSPVSLTISRREQVSPAYPGRRYHAAGVPERTWEDVALRDGSNSRSRKLRARVFVSIGPPRARRNCAVPEANFWPATSFKQCAMKCCL
jgi:hypothetical protein